MTGTGRINRDTLTFSRSCERVVGRDDEGSKAGSGVFCSSDVGGVWANGKGCFVSKVVQGNGI